EVNRCTAWKSPDWIPGAVPGPKVCPSLGERAARPAHRLYVVWAGAVGGRPVGAEALPQVGHDHVPVFVCIDARGLLTWRLDADPTVRRRDVSVGAVTAGNGVGYPPRPRGDAGSVLEVEEQLQPRPDKILRHPVRANIRFS